MELQTSSPNATDLRVDCNFKMMDSFAPVIQVPKKDIYKGVKIMHKIYNRKGNGSDWALVKLVCNVVRQVVVRFVIKRRKKVKK